ncbi:MAG: hypothetical protein C1O27_001853 [Chloroflexi bacterium]|nr:MAG: hypothetical protein C1O27_001853 [Chloroflexota bacterium]
MRVRLQIEAADMRGAEAMEGKASVMVGRGECFGRRRNANEDAKPDDGIDPRVGME